MTDKTTSEHRSEVIEKSINIEWLVSAIITQHYFKRTYEPFLLEVLYDEYFSFGLKSKILEKIIKKVDTISMDKSIINKLNRLNTIRNYFAHCNQEFIEKEPAVARYLYEYYIKLGGEFIPNELFNSPNDK